MGNAEVESRREVSPRGPQVKTINSSRCVLLQYYGTVTKSIERSIILVASYQPNANLTTLMERYHAVPQLCESVAHDESGVVFGSDLREWAEGGRDELTSGDEKKEFIPPIPIVQCIRRSV